MAKLREYRTKAKMTQADLAKLTGISLRTIQDYDQERKPLERAAAATVLTIADALGCTVEDLIR